MELRVHFIEAVACLIEKYLEKEQLLICSREINSTRQYHWDCNGILKFVLIDSEYNEPQQPRVLDHLCVVNGVLWRTSYSIREVSTWILIVESYETNKQIWNKCSTKEIPNAKFFGFQTLFVPERQQLWTVEGNPEEEDSERVCAIQVGFLRLIPGSTWVHKICRIEFDKWTKPKPPEGRRLKPLCFVVTSHWIYILSVELPRFHQNIAPFGFLLHQLSPDLTLYHHPYWREPTRTANVGLPFCLPDKMLMSYLEKKDCLHICQKHGKNFRFDILRLKDISWDFNFSRDPNYCDLRMGYEDSKIIDIDLLQFRFQRENKKERNEFVVQYTDGNPQFALRKSIPNLYLRKTEYAYVSVLPEHIKTQIK
jgi:hypothetical protein